jgi:hypothetical protein
MMADSSAAYDATVLRLLKLSPFERRPRGGGWRFGTKTIKDTVVTRLTASGRAEIRGNKVYLISEEPAE